jgi:hypothetical protein
MEALNQQYAIENLHLGPIAQLGARLNGIEKVAGSNPAGSTQGRHCAERVAFDIISVEQE